MTLRRQTASLIPAAHLAILVAGGVPNDRSCHRRHELAVLTLEKVMAGSTGAAVLHLAHRSLLAAGPWPIGSREPSTGLPRETPAVRPHRGGLDVLTTEVRDGVAW